MSLIQAAPKLWGCVQKPFVIMCVCTLLFRNCNIHLVAKRREKFSSHKPTADGRMKQHKRRINTI